MHHVAEPLCAIGQARTRSPRAAEPLLLVVAALLSIVWATPKTVFAQESAIAEIDRTMENYRLDAHIPGWYGRSCRTVPRDAHGCRGSAGRWTPNLRDRRDAFSHRVNDQGVYRALNPEAPR